MERSQARNSTRLFFLLLQALLMLSIPNHFYLCILQNCSITLVIIKLATPYHIIHYGMCQVLSCGPELPSVLQLRPPAPGVLLRGVSGLHADVPLPHVRLPLLAGHLHHPRESTAGLGMMWF